jgi:hypothetical protein
MHVSLHPVLIVLVATAAAVMPVSPLPSDSVAVAAAGQQPTVHMCGVIDPDRYVRPSAGSSAPTSSAVVTGIAPVAVVWSAGSLYVLDGAGKRVLVYDAHHTLVRSVPLTWAATGLSVDHTGAVYLLRPPYEVVKLSAAGTVQWERSLKSPVRGVFGHESSQGWRLGVSHSDGTSDLLDAAGNTMGKVPVDGRTFTSTGGVLVAADGRYVRTYDVNFGLRTVVGDAAWQSDPMPTGAPRHFYLQGGAIRLSDGRLLVADAGGYGIALLSPDGLLLGAISESVTGQLTQLSPLATDGTHLYYATGKPYSSTQSVSRIPLAAVVVWAEQASMGEPQLGYGAGLEVVGARAKHVPAGQTPAVRATFDPWWKSLGDLALDYRIRTRAQVLDDADPAFTRVVVTPSLVDTGAELSLPPAAPGYYEVEAFLVRGGVRISGTCTSYTVGASSHQLDFSALPGGFTAGGPDPARGVALADVLGTGAFRDGFDWTFLMPNKTGPLDFSKYDAAIAAGAAESAKRGIPFVMQLGQGGPEKSLVSDGTWEARVKEVVARYKDKVDYWEAWNEPNITYGSGGSYVTNVLAPVYRAVKAADPTAKVVGGSTVGVSVPYWDQIANAGGLAYMDIVGIHPYTGHNRSFEEEGTGRQVTALKDLLVARGHGGKLIWVTEHAWWSNGEGSLFAQADYSARALLWYRQWGVARWAYFLAQGTWGNNGVTFSAIQGGDNVKPAALALMTAKAQTSGRALLATGDASVPHLFSQRYGPSGASSDELVALWSDDVSLTVGLQNNGTARRDLVVTDVLGASRTVAVPAGRTLSIKVDGSPQYVRVPLGGDLAIVPDEAYGPNLALKAVGATASASSEGTWNAAKLAIDGVTDAKGQGDFRSSPAWASAVGDASPSLTVTLAAPATVDRVFVSTVGLNSILPGVESFQVSVKVNGAWVEVAGADNVFFRRGTLLRFPARTVSAVRISVDALNWTGYAAGLKPSFWPTDEATLTDPTKPFYGPAILREVEVYAPGAQFVAEEYFPEAETTIPSTNDGPVPITPGDGTAPGSGSRASAPAPGRSGSVGARPARQPAARIVSLGSTSGFTGSSRARVRWTWPVAGSARGATFDVRWKRAAFHSRFGAWNYPRAWQRTSVTKGVLRLRGQGSEYCVAVRVRTRDGKLSAWSPQRCVARTIGRRQLETTRDGAILLGSRRVTGIALEVQPCDRCRKLAVVRAGKVLGVLDPGSLLGRKPRLVAIGPFPSARGKVTVRPVDLGQAPRVTAVAVSQT